MTPHTGFYQRNAGKKRVKYTLKMHEMCNVLVLKCKVLEMRKKHQRKILNVKNYSILVWNIQIIIVYIHIPYNIYKNINIRF